MEEVFDDLVGKFWTNDRIVELQTLANQQGWKCIPRQRYAEQPISIKSFDLFKGKRGKRLIGISTSHDEIVESTIRIYDYIYYSDGGKKKTTVVEITSPRLHLSPFVIRPRNSISVLWHKTLNTIKSRGTEFDDNYSVEASDQDATDLQLPDSLFEIIADLQDIYLEGDGNSLLLYRKAKELPSPAILEQRDIALQIAESIVLDREKEFV